MYTTRFTQMQLLHRSHPFSSRNLYTESKALFKGDRIYSYANFTLIAFLLPSRHSRNKGRVFPRVVAIVQQNVPRSVVGPMLNDFLWLDLPLKGTLGESFPVLVCELGRHEIELKSEESLNVSWEHDVVRDGAVCLLVKDNPELS